MRLLSRRYLFSRIIKYNLCTFFVGACWGQPMIFFWKLVPTIKMSTSQNFKTTFKYNLTCTFLSLRAKLKKTLFPWTPCMIYKRGLLIFGQNLETHGHSVRLWSAYTSLVWCGSSLPSATGLWVGHCIHYFSIHDDFQRNETKKPSMPVGCANKVLVF